MAGSGYKWDAHKAKKPQMTRVGSGLGLLGGLVDIAAAPGEDTHQRHEHFEATRARVDRDFATAIDPAARKKRKQKNPPGDAAPAPTYAGLHGQRRACRAVAGQKLAPIVVEVAGRVRAQLRSTHQTITACFRNFDVNDDGRLSLAEVRRGFSRACRVVLSDKEAKALFAEHTIKFWCEWDSEARVDICCIWQYWCRKQ